MAVGDARLVLVAGTTETARIDGISAAGAEPDVLAHTPSADAELLAYGDVVRAPAVPESPTGCPTPALATRAAREVLGFDLTVVDGGLDAQTAAPTVSVGAAPGQDVREPEPVSTAPGAFTAAKRLGARLPEDELVLAETVPGGTTTALAVLTALGEDATVSSSLPENPIERKREVVTEALEASGASEGSFAGDPLGALRYVGDPVLAVVAGLAVGAAGAGTRVTLGGGTQLLAAAAVCRHYGCDAPLRLATTSFLAADVPIREAGADLGLDVAVTDPGFDGVDHVAAERYLAGEAKEGAGMGGALDLAARADALDETRARFLALADALGGEAD
jgi:uncharacterized protein (TIGR00303 family)